MASIIIANQIASNANIGKTLLLSSSRSLTCIFDWHFYIWPLITLNLEINVCSNRLHIPGSVRVIDAGNVSVSLDLIATFDNVDHCVLLDVLRHCFGVTDVALNWFRSYLPDHTQSLSVVAGTWKPVNLACSVPHGSMIGRKVQLHTQRTSLRK